MLSSLFRSAAANRNTNKLYQTELRQASIDYYLMSTYLWMSIWLFGFYPRYLNFASVSKCLLATFVSCYVLRGPG